jgi:exopolyphosphatase/guanosine-5'-triphosphate,3'-diphosphate pyrophosphatase
MRFASIDLGTNTVRLLVADADEPRRWQLVHHEQRVTRLGEGLWPAGELREPAMARTRDVVADYVNRARALGATAVRVVATSAVREARNGTAFAASLASLTAVPVDVVSGDDEARLTVRGVFDALRTPDGASIVFDIGGGSTEYIRTETGRVVQAVSLRLGVVPLAEEFPFPERVEHGRYREMEDAIADRLAREVPGAIAHAPIGRLIGTAGTVTTLAALDLDLQVYDAARVHGHRLSRAAIERQLARLGALTVEARAALPALEPGRADLIVPGIAIVLATFRRLGVDTLVVSDAGLREGMMAEAVERLFGADI